MESGLALCLLSSPMLLNGNHSAIVAEWCDGFWTTAIGRQWCIYMAYFWSSTIDNTGQILFCNSQILCILLGMPCPCCCWVLFSGTYILPKISCIGFEVELTLKFRFYQFGAVALRSSEYELNQQDWGWGGNADHGEKGKRDEREWWQSH